MKENKNQSGFGSIEVLLTLIVVILLVFVGWYIYHTDHKTTTSSNKTTSSTSTKTISYFTITQWGVRAAYSGNLTLEYSSPTGSAPAMVYLSSAQLDASDTSSGSSCSNQQYGGVISRYASTDEYLSTEDGSPSGETVAQYFSGTNPHTSNYVVVGNYYYIYSGPQAACSSLPTSQVLQTQTISVFKTLVQNFKAV